MLRNRAMVLLWTGLTLAACGGSKHGSTSGLPGGGTNGGGGASALSIGADASLAKGRTRAFQALLTSSGVVDDCTSSAQWTSSDPAVASVAGGVATALLQGQTTITASCSGSTGSAVLVVTDPEVDAIAIAPATGELPVGLQEQLVATATLSDQSTADVSADVVWSSSNTFAFTVTPGGVILAKSAPGQTSTFTAFHAASGKLATATRTVTSATLQSIAVTASAASPVAFDPLAPSVPLGVDVQFHAIGTFSDDQSADVTPSMTWTASPATVASFSTPAGLATTNATGTTTITATPSGGVAPASATLTVTAPVVTSVSIDQNAAALGVGETLQLTGTASYTDDSTASVTLTGWTSSVPGVATVSDTGLLTAVAPGFATIGASYPAPGGTVSATTQVNVVAPTASPILSYISLKPGSVKGGKPFSVTVALTSPATEDTVVTLASLSAYVTVPSTVTIPSGQSTASVQATTTRPPSKRKVKVTATLGTATRTATLNLR